MEDNTREAKRDIMKKQYNQDEYYIYKEKMVINTLPLLSEITGIGRYTYEISKYLQHNNNFSIKYFYGYYSKVLVDPSKKSNLKNLKSSLVKITLIKRIARKILTNLNRFFVPGFKLYWEPNFIPFDHIKSKNIITSVHDFSFILHKEFHPKERIEYFEKYFFKNIYKSDSIICFSNFTKNEILDQLNFDENKIKVIYHGIDHNIFKVYNDLDVPFKLPKKFILSVGSIEPRKNLLSLLKAYNCLEKSIKDEYHLALAGFVGWENKEIIFEIEQNKENIHYLGYITDKELAKVYNLASIFVFPSFYEGFGLPPLEAMACGTPVVSSNVASMPEICGDAAVYCNPLDIKDIKEKIEVVLLDQNLQSKMIEKGLNRVKQFTWEKSAQEHIRVFKQVLKADS